MRKLMTRIRFAWKRRHAWKFSKFQNLRSYRPSPEDHGTVFGYWLEYRTKDNPSGYVVQTCDRMPPNTFLANWKHERPHAEVTRFGWRRIK